MLEQNVQLFENKSSQKHAPLLVALQKYLTDRHVPFYMPGHKRGGGIDGELIEVLGERLFQLDLPELPGLDEKIKEAENLAAQAYGSQRSWFLTNGSTLGVQAMLLATCRQGDEILIGRNCHRATIAGLILTGAQPIYVMSDYNERYQMDLGVSPTALDRALQKHPNVKAVLLVSPNYFGVCGDLAQNIQLCHDRDIPILIDSAHGAHLGFHSELPPAPIDLGADLVVQSTHKTTTSLTQSALLHLCSDRVSPDRVEEALGILASTSPSLILLTSIDVARRQMSLHGQELLTQVIFLAQLTRERIRECTNLHIPNRQEISTLDSTRLTLCLHKGTGYHLDNLLCNHPSNAVIGEMPTLHHLVLSLSVGNRQIDIDRLIDCLQSIEVTNMPPSPQIPPPLALPPAVLSPQAAYFATAEQVIHQQSVGRIARSLVCPYPPGIPLLCPGEMITREAIEYLSIVHQAGGVIPGWHPEGTVSVVK